jgi:1,5-anhydro-D-fructose reductase (1,5-anhydro-D-mannitol-forming)
MIRVAMLSFWHVHAGDYVKQSKAHPEVEIVGAWDEDPERGRARAADAGIDYVDDLDTLLARDDVDAVICDTPTSLHPEVLVKAAKAGKHIFTEKVLATTIKDANAIKAAVDEAGVVLTLSLPRVYEAYTPTIRAIIDSGGLGEINETRARVSHGGSIDNWLPEHFYDPETTGGGAMIDFGCHPMYLNRIFQGGMPDSVSSTFGFVTGRAVEDNACVVLKYANGSFGIVEAGFVNRMSPASIEVHGTDGSLLFGTPEAKLLKRAKGDDAFVEVPLLDREPMAFVQWIDHIKAGTTFDSNVALGLDLTRLMEAATISARSGESVAISSLAE